MNICGLEGCGRPIYVKKMCRPHYTKNRSETVERCSVEGCLSPKHTQGMCGKHAARMKKHGRTDDSCLERSANKGQCSVEGCENPMRQKTWCASHYSQWRLLGEVRPNIRKWSERGPCLVCGEPCEGRGRRTYCSGKCQVLAGRSGGMPDKTKKCTRCGDDIDLFALGPAGRKKRSDSSMCSDCKHARRTTRHHMSIKRLVQRDGVNCSICGDEVDLTLKKPEMFSPSVDHVIPYSLGGTHDPENLALAHLWCNQVKRNRVGWVFTNP